LKILIAEDNLAGRKFLNEFLSGYGDCDLVIDGMEAIEAYSTSLSGETPYDLICLDIMMPRVDGVRALKAIRDLEKQKGVKQEKQAKIIMTTVLAESDLVKRAFEFGCDAYASKPIDIIKFIEALQELGLIKKDD